MKYVALFIIICYGCSTVKTGISGRIKPGARISIDNIQIIPASGKKNSDTVCTCTGTSIGKALIPWLQQAGFTVVENYDKGNTPVDYILSGSGTADIIGKRRDVFIRSLSLSIKDVQDETIMVSSSFTGVSIRPVTAANKIGEKLVEKLKK